MTPSAPPLVAHLVGSVPLADPTTVFRKVGADLGPFIRSLPDGETGRRADWIGFVRRSLGRNPAFEKDTDAPLFQFKQWDGKVIMEWPLLRFAGARARSAATFETGYADDAIASYALFARARAEGAIPAGVKFQICAATPLAISYMYITPADQRDFTAAYSEHLITEIGKIAAALPAGDLSFQWDVCQEVLMWEGFFAQPKDYRDEILSSLARIGNAVPAAIDLGYHLCYGSPADEHCVIPKDLGVAVEIANGIFSRLARPLRYLHLPVPHDRADAEYVRPLGDLALPPGAQFYLGCVHPGDARGNAERLTQAQRFTSVGGIGSECGWGRADPVKLHAIIAAHRSLIGG
jgi:hypothetical protein